MSKGITFYDYEEAVEYASQKHEEGVATEIRKQGSKYIVNLKGELPTKHKEIMKLYHVTPTSNLPNILKHGLQPRPGGTFKDPEVGSDEARIYLTEDPKDVLDHALKYVGNWAVLEVQVENSRLQADPYEEGHYYLTEEISPSNIRIIREK